MTILPKHLLNAAVLLTFAVVSLASLTGLAGAGPLPGAAAIVELGELLDHNPGVRWALSETAEGRAIAERLQSALREPGRAELAERLAPRLERVAQLDPSQAGARDAARAELASLTESLGDAPSSLQTAREEFIHDRSAPRGKLKVAAVQYPVEGGRTLNEMLAKMESYARQARDAGAGLVVFPELISLDRVDSASALSEADQLAAIAHGETPRVFEFARQLSRELDIAILAGSFPRARLAAEGGGIVNTALLAFPDGRVVMQDKLNLTPDEAAWGWRTGDELKVFDAPWGRSTILICYDSQFAALSAQLAESAPELILIPSMTGAKGFKRVRWAAQARAVEHHAFVVVTGTVDAPGSATSEYSARAAFLTPQDTGFSGLIRQGPRDRAAIVYSDLDLAKLRASRQKAGLYSARDQGRRVTPVRVTRP